MRSILVVVWWAGWVAAWGGEGAVRPWPSWLEAEVRASQGWDSNVYWMEVGRWAGRGSWFSSAGVELTARGKLGEVGTVKGALAVEPVRYGDEPLEDHVKTTGMISASGKQGEWAWEGEGRVRWVEGDGAPLVWDGAGGAPALGGYEIRDRRDQWGWQYQGGVTWRPEGWLGRVRLQGVGQDFMTAERAVVGCQNYVDRSEVVCGLDGGVVVMGTMAAGVGVRVGRQEQAALLDSAVAYDNEFVRPVVVVTGSPGEGWKIEGEAGLDLRRYTGELPAGEPRTRVEWVHRVAVVWETGEPGRLSVEARQAPFPSSSGRGMFRDGVWGVEWKKPWAGGWSTAAGCGVQENDFFPAQRRDRVYRPRMELGWQGEAGWKWTVGYEYAWSESGVAGTPAREFERHRVTAGAAWRF